ncbi:QsdR family transcriptional regulator [Solwaraspora sp. WMMA2059]|uniref:QsdR family transcriptional regulator n=1 Tax=Solwaraspora sp. WMMA2059 TaxID=3015160 RepID=UPI00248B8A93|nr:QsdR family transcriptional regulator [Solwaraspora sp. WMMA2059]WBC00363.1 QsdR family transcriptional regulator [Solwaraspora sp. WMMA2059]
MIEVTTRYAVAVRRSAPFRQFLADEPGTAARVLFAEPGRVHRRFIRAQVDIFVDVLGPDLANHAAPESLAYLYIRIVEPAIYAELLTGRQPDLDLRGGAAGREIARSGCRRRRSASARPR